MSLIKKKVVSRFHDKYILTDTVLGEGAQGKVFVAKRRRDYKQVAAKFIRDKPPYIRKLRKGEFVPDEIYFLDKVKDIDGCLKMLDYYVEKDGCWIVTEYDETSMTLREYIEDYGGLDESSAAYVFTQIVSAFLQMEDAGIAYKDLKCDNVLVDEFFTVTIIDFGSVTELDDLNYFYSDGYIPPEVEDELLNYMFGAVTSWSLGVILGSILIGGEPFEFGLRSRKVKKLIVRRMKKLRCSKLAWDLVSKCLELNCDERPEIREIIYGHPWFNNYMIEPESNFPEESRSENKEAKLGELNPINIKHRKLNPVCDCSQLKIVWKNQERSVRTKLKNLLMIAGVKHSRQKYTQNTSIWEAIRQCRSTLEKLKVYQSNYCIRNMKGVASSLQKQIDRTNYLCAFWTSV
ncbi:hypothetical protein QYM36_005436 [Artemia franciscana]|uniref:Serine/threonine-protein kinase 1 n=1 Tax=Artemia franciscana TaxID=6661 RepID=A0AA88I4M4_ARTSF|nr:hypothetical protein QYM36_005436 [Artemia franciscana]